MPIVQPKEKGSIELNYVEIELSSIEHAKYRLKKDRKYLFKIGLLTNMVMPF